MTVGTVGATLTSAPHSVVPNDPGERVELGLTGMTCAACAARIEKVVNRMPGAHATVNFATETATVVLDRKLADPQAVIAAVGRAGYGATLRRDAEVDRLRDKARRAEEFRALRRDLIVSALLTLPLVAQMV